MAFGVGHLKHSAAIVAEIELGKVLGKVVVQMSLAGMLIDPDYAALED